MHRMIVLLVALFVGAAYAPAAAETPELDGFYAIKGVNANNEGEYSAFAQIKKTGETYSILFQSGNVRYLGTGIMMNDILSVVYQPLVPNASAGIASYRVHEDTITSGRWSLLGSKVVGSEIWARREKAGH
ncbi:hypothetical protein COU20_03185 [Candidatus Kaiserbacteria bacterium CG10_big_fil_rev_8_21_14_0_10_59_10]|uniref:DUF5666 domain-containing protein n=1 Tax=Candidatus Kaiserbacteria bacterium CG10_big_fil_rev_8_21_14_0_10_59_10 TaxID=1974612 RepID=A0A2H0U793_9BACT|nr:MAG: hypothetical protein COU20_03185 [Candidatus Kaiserbacteria bacterium CG10_big_fil_rev_8_21_14_0_10_59_10]